jgi:SAM-dependent methyltransferase
MDNGPIVDDIGANQAFWNAFARYDPLWAILSDPSKSGRRWGLREFLATGRREVSLLMYQLRAIGLEVGRGTALDFGCGVGRLSLPLAAYFDQVVGIDISPEMIRLANDINPSPKQVRYVCNGREDLAAFASGEFAFMYSNVVLQHIEPARAVRYLRELFRVVRSGGVLVFQLPSHQRPAEVQRPRASAMTDAAYRASVHIEGLPQSVAAGAELVVSAAVTNTSAHPWAQSNVGPIRLGNHWLAVPGHTMLVQDDGRASLPEHVAPGQRCRVVINVTAPPEPGEYELECDVVHEGISWFADKGSETWRCPVHVAGTPHVQRLRGAIEPAVADGELSLPDISALAPPGPLPMHGIHRDVVTSLVEELHATLVRVELDERCGPEWIGYRYFARKNE